MIDLSGINVNGVQNVQINGAHISAKVNGKFIQIRGYKDMDMSEGGKWYDEKHQQVMQAVHTLERAIADILAS